MSTARSSMSRNLLKKSLTFVKSGGPDKEKCRSNSLKVGKEPEVVGINKEHSKKRSETKTRIPFQQKKRNTTSTEGMISSRCVYTSFTFYILPQLCHLLRGTTYTSPQDEG